jgi:hypothetical protein
LLNGINKLVFVMVNFCVLFEVQTETLNIIQTRFGFKGLNVNSKVPARYLVVDDFMWMCTKGGREHGSLVFM